MSKLPDYEVYEDMEKGPAVFEGDLWETAAWIRENLKGLKLENADVLYNETMRYVSAEVFLEMVKQIEDRNEEVRKIVLGGLRLQGLQDVRNEEPAVSMEEIAEVAADKIIKLFEGEK